MSRNLVHYDLEKLDQLPYRGKLHDILTTSLKIKRERWKYSMYKSDCKHWTKAKKIIQGSVGTHIDVIFPKVKTLLRKFKEDVIEQFNYLIDREVLCEGESQLIGYRDSPGKVYGYYINLDGIISYKDFKKYKRKPYSTPITNFKEHYDYQSKKRRLYKQRTEEKKKAGLCFLRLINNPALYKFYLDLRRKKESLIYIIRKTPDAPPEIEYYKESYLWKKGYVKVLRDNPKAHWLKRMKYWKRSIEAIKKNAKQAEKDIIPIIDQMTELERGNYNQFFESDAYLYNLQKPCHHFEQP